MRFDEVLSAQSSEEVAERLFELANASQVLFHINGYDVTIHQDPSVVGTGGCIWDTAFVLARWAQPRIRDWRSRLGSPPRALRCLEVGAGCGLLGIALSHLPGVQVILTEQASAMANLTRNCDANPPPTAVPSSRSSASATAGGGEGGEVRGGAEAMKLDWSSSDDVARAVSRGPYDLIIGTDVVYCEAAVEPLLVTLHACAGAETVVWLCLQEREPTASARLLELAPRYFQDVVRAPMEGEDDLPFSGGVECYLLRLERRRPPNASPDALPQGSASATNAPTPVPAVEAADGAAAARIAAETELLRRDAFRTVRQAFLKRCRAVRQTKGGALSCFSKWHFALLRRSAAAATAATAPPAALASTAGTSSVPAAGTAPSHQQAAPDPLLPANVTAASDLAALVECLSTELIADGFPPADATHIARGLTHGDLAKTSSKLAKRIAWLSAQAGPPGHAAAPPITLQAASKGAGLAELSYGAAALTLQLSEERLADLRRAYDASSPAARGEGGSGGGGGGGGGGDVEQAFLGSVLALLVRYQSLDGGGFQCAVPRSVFRVLEDEWGVDCEGFASPLNCTLGAGRYCSAFPDVDGRFGSRGSFFADDGTARSGGGGGVGTGAGAHRPACSSYQLNPPFSPELYAALLAHCYSRLAAAESSGKSLSYILIIGATAPTLQLACIQEMMRSHFFRGSFVVGVAKHVYVCGRQHMKAPGATFRACDTGVYVLQTSCAARAWPATEPRLSRLREAFEAFNGAGGTPRE